jgi:GNAT superfamily N-acetyltransferase
MPPFRSREPRPPPVSVRAAVAADIPQLLTLIQLYWDFEGIARFKGPQVESLLRRLLGTPDLGAAWVAEAKPRLVGYAVGVQVLSLEHQGLIGEIDEFFVLPEVRSRGIGTELLAALETALAGNGCVRLELQLGIANHPARAFYHRHGFAARDGYQLLDKPLRR